ncbi:SIR2 family protein [Mycolicibacterium flavescens]|uniref:Uncharacterized protein n=1 Tax=Mycolicibacterium flavescens TaxID=1776 RepID=A0A1E3RM30_MYCFV|nr:SIR2 family protein [Mycolicibacterium flavescens]MCV7281689.1 SIR2 family protein [Mycolicibacterium flavescens]ODQ90908.1 hypothetical protein BHQ18_09380 [Mycolicibacterium flavescens]
MGGHLFIINGDLTKIACDAILVPTDSAFTIEAPWDRLLAGRKDERPDSWRGRRVIALPPRSKEPRIWLGNVGQVGHSSDFSAFEPIVRDFVVEAAAEARRNDDTDRIYAWPKPRLAVNVVGSGQGGGSQKKGNLIRGLVKTLTELAAEYDADIVLVTFGPKSYAAAQRARRQVVQKESETWGFIQSNSPLIEEAHRLANDAIDRHLVLFVGAGASAGAGLPTWKKLLDDLAIEAGFDDEMRKRLAERDLRDQATLIERELKRRGGNLKRSVAERLGNYQRFSLTHGLLASLPSSEAVTTNYDKLFETAYETRGREVAVLPNNPRTTDGHWLLKLHGTVDAPETITLTRSDYLNMPRQYGALMGLVQGLLLMRRMVFVGYSLEDEDFHELIDEVRAARGDTMEIGRGVALTLCENPLDRQLWAKDLDIVPMVTDPGIKIPEAARELELFLDLVGYLSTTSASFFLDESYSDLSDNEAELRDALATLATKTAGSPVDSVSHMVERFLRDLGASN